ncbi:MAG TPA: hypothetical protein VGO40_02585 [Longimicrobium sp.]|jgi:hypothetical protein|nr:hypothetical protein [Longimicrobium sp.]
MPTLRAVLRAASAAALVFAAACADSTSAPVQPAPEAPASVRLVCQAEVATLTVRCAAPGAAAGVRADRILGQGTGVKLTSSNIAVVADSFSFDMTVTNQFEFPIGTTDGVNPDPNGIRVFFVDGIHTTGGTGSVTVANADGVDVFTAAGQAYFAYPGVLQPGAATAARRWKLRFDPGVTTFTFGLYVSTPVPPGGGTVALTILEPVADTTFIDSVVVRARIDSAPASVLSVKAFAAGQSVVLSPYAAGLVKGTLHLPGQPFGPLQIRVHAVTVRADTGNAFVTIRRDAPPTMTVTEPTLNMVARPNLRIDVDCVDDNPAGCASLTARIGAVQLASGTTGIHTDVSLAAMNETQQVVQIDALDSGGHSRTASVNVIVESRAVLAFVDSAGSLAVDLDSSRLLFADAAHTVWLRDRVGGTRTAVQASPFLGFAGVEGRLHSQGAIYLRLVPGTTGRVYEWRSGAFVDLNAPATSLVAEGDWAAWVNGSQFTRRDLAAGTSMTLSAAQPDVAANGDLVYASGGGVKRLRAGVTTSVDAGSGALTDGINVVYLKSFQVTMWDGTTATTLSNTLISAAPRTHYEANGGWVAYAMADGGGNSQIRTRAPGGTDRQVTLFGSSSQIRALSADGTVVFGNAGVLYVLRAPYTAAPTRLGRDWYNASFRGTGLLLFLGNTVFSATY